MKEWFYWCGIVIGKALQGLVWHINKMKLYQRQKHIQTLFEIKLFNNGMFRILIAFYLNLTSVEKGGYNSYKALVIMS